MATPAEMDLAAESAEKELTKLLGSPSSTAKDLIQWWKSHYLRAGHKRLGRILVEHSRSKKA